MAIGHADICVRTADPKALALLRGGCGCSLLSPEGLPLLRGIARLNPHRVFGCRFGPIEVYQSIPGPKDKTPSGPHTNVLPRLLALCRTHAATLPIPDGWIPCMTLFPPNPIDDHGGVRSFDRPRYEAFEGLWRHYGIPELVALKNDIFAAMSDGRPSSPRDLPPPFDRAGRATARVAIRQWRQIQSYVE